MNTAIAKKPLRQCGDVRELLQNDQAREQLAAVAAKHMSPERLMRVTANAIRTTPKLQNCEPLSFLGALMQCAALGLEPNTVLGHAYLIPFDNSRKIDGKWVKIPEVQVIIGYKGLIDLARRSGHITSISANIHYDDDEMWKYEEGTEAQLRHIPGPQDGKPLHAYAIAKFVEGGHAYVVLPWARVLKIRDGSQGWQSAVKFNKTQNSPWFTHEDAMAKKTAIRALAKYLPLSVDFKDAVSIDNDGDRHVDYAKFAMNPHEGATIDGSVVTEDEDDGPIEDEAKAKPEPEPKKKAEPKPREKVDYNPDDESPAEKKPETKTAEKSKGDNATTPPFFAALRSDLEDGAPVDATRNFYAEKIDALDEADTKALEALFAEFELE